MYLELYASCSATYIFPASLRRVSKRVCINVLCLTKQYHSTKVLKNDSSDDLFTKYVKNVRKYFLNKVLYKNKRIFESFFCYVQFKIGPVCVCTNQIIRLPYNR